MFTHVFTINKPNKWDKNIVEVHKKEKQNDLCVVSMEIKFIVDPVSQP